MKTETKRHLGRFPLTTYLPEHLAQFVKAKAERKSISPATWLRELVSETFANEYEAQLRQQQQMQQAYAAAIARQNGGA